MVRISLGLLGDTASPMQLEYANTKPHGVKSMAPLDGHFN